MKGYIRLLRPGNCIMGVIAVLIGALITLGDYELLAEHWQEVFLACVVVVSFTGAGNALNDFYDMDIDKVNHPERPIPSGDVNPAAAVYLTGILFLFALAMSFFINRWAVLIVVINLAFMISYEVALKRRGFVGNLEIGWLTCSLFIFGAFSVFGENWEAMLPIWVLALLSFLATMGREIAKDIQDLEGDVDRITLPKSIGVRKAGDIASTAFLAGIVLSPLPYFLGIFDWQYLAIVFIADAMFIYSASILVDDPAGTSDGAKYAMYAALVAFLAGGLI